MAATLTAQVGDPLPEFLAKASNVYAREQRDGEDNIHDDTAAQRMGFQRGFVAGGQSIGWMSRSLVAYFGKAYFETGQFEAKFVSPVYDDEPVTSKGTVRERQETADGLRLVCDVWLEKADGTRAVIGTASALVR